MTTKEQQLIDEIKREVCLLYPIFKRQWGEE